MVKIYLYQGVSYNTNELVWVAEHVTHVEMENKNKNKEGKKNREF